MRLGIVSILNQKTSERLLLVPSLVVGSVLLSGISGPLFDGATRGARASNSTVQAVTPSSEGALAPKDLDIACHEHGLPVCRNSQSPTSLNLGKDFISGLHRAWGAIFRESFGTASRASGDGSLQIKNSPLLLTSASAVAMQDFNARCTARGVVYCQGFDDASGFQQKVNIFPNASYPTVFPTKDTTVGRSGSSLRIDIPPLQSANSGKFDTSFPAIGGANTDFYFQVATRISPEMLTNYANSATTHWPTWKNHAFFNGVTSCTDMSVVTALNYDGAIPVATTNCSANGLYTNGGVPPTLLQQGDYNCPYRGEKPAICFYWLTNTWITFYYHVHLGNYNSTSDHYDNTTVQAWVAVNGQPYKQWVNISGWSMGANGNGKWDHLELYSYMTGKDAKTTYPTAHVWYDELIISTLPIAAPAVPPAAP